jgi:hypothetical protein
VAVRNEFDDFVAAVSSSSVFDVDRRVAYVDSSWSGFAVFVWKSLAIANDLQHGVVHIEQVIQN